MKFWMHMAWASAASRRFVLVVSMLAVAVSSAVVLGVTHIRDEVRNSFANAISGVDLIVGSRDSPTELLMYTVFGLGQASRSMPYGVANQIAAMPGVAWVVPVQLGDYYKDSPVMGTNASYFQHVLAANQTLEFVYGQPFAQDNEVVIGSEVAAKHAISLGAKLVLSHGYSGSLAQQHSDSPFTVVGILRATGTPIDRKVLVSLQGFERIHVGWELGVAPQTLQAIGAQLAPATTDITPTSVTALMVGLSSPARVFGVRRTVERMNGGSLMAVMPGVTLAKLWQTLAIGESALLVVGWLTALSAMLGAVATTMLSLQGRRRELAIWRSLGARPTALLSMVMVESLAVMLAGMCAGYGLLQLFIAWGSGTLRTLTGVALHHTLPSPQTWWMLAGLTLAAVLASLIPALQAYRWSLQDSLNPKTTG